MNGGISGKRNGQAEVHGDPQVRPSRPGRICLLGLPLDLVTLDEAVRIVVERIERGQCTFQVSLNAAKYVRAEEDPRLRDVIRRADLVCADGMGPVIAARLAGHPVPERVPGIDLMYELLAVADRRQWPVYLLGTRPHVIERAVAAARRTWPGLPIAGYHHGYFSPDDELRIVEAIRASGARLLFVATGSPRQELFLGRWFPELTVLYAMGVGGSFDILAGIGRRAPRWVQNAGLEGFYRMLREPRRRWRRVLMDNSRFLWLVLKNRHNLGRNGTGMAP